MKAILTDGDNCLTDIQPTKPPPGVPMARWRTGFPAGQREGKFVAWSRGHQAGIYDAYRTLKKKYPRVAEEFRKAFGMEKDGSYRL